MPRRPTRADVERVRLLMPFDYLDFAVGLKWSPTVSQSIANLLNWVAENGLATQQKCPFKVCKIDSTLERKLHRALMKLVAKKVPLRAIALKLGRTPAEVQHRIWHAQQDAKSTHRAARRRKP